MMKKCILKAESAREGHYSLECVWQIGNYRQKIFGLTIDDLKMIKEVIDAAEQRPEGEGAECLPEV